MKYNFGLDNNSFLNWFILIFIFINLVLYFKFNTLLILNLIKINYKYLNLKA